MIATFHDLKDKHILITGGANGIGSALVHGFLQQGAHISFLDKDAQQGHTLESDAQNKHTDTKVHFHHTDLMIESQITSAIDAAVNNLGPVDVLINNAASDPRYHFDDMTTEQWDDLFKLNVGHYFIAARHIIPGMRKQRSGSIIMVSSVEFWLGGSQLVCYAATKAAIIGMVRSLAASAGKDNIRVNGIAPGWIMTERQLKEMVTPEIKQKLIDEWQILDYHLTPEMLVTTFLFLASDASKTITRQVILADAGFARG